jgi:hypothetical protein
VITSNWPGGATTNFLSRVRYDSAVRCFRLATWSCFVVVLDPTGARVCTRRSGCIEA